jgi:hypothetical protein
LLTQVNVFFPKPIQSGGSDYACDDRNPEGPSCVNKVKVDNSTASYGDQCQRHDQVYYAVERSHKIKIDRANHRVKGLCVSNLAAAVLRDAGGAGWKSDGWLGSSLLGRRIDKCSPTGFGNHVRFRTWKSPNVQRSNQVRDFDTRSQCCNDSPTLTSRRKLIQ